MSEASFHDAAAASEPAEMTEHALTSLWLPGIAALRPPRLAVVLAAGSSERMRQKTGGGSKAVLTVGGLPLLERTVRTLLASGVDKVVVVAGDHEAAVGEVVARMASDRVRLVWAEHWGRGNGGSLTAAQAAIAAEPLFALVMMDHLFGAGVLERLLNAGRPAALVDLAPTAEVWAEGTRVRLVEGLATAFGKHLDEAAVDCGAFLLPGEIFACLESSAAEGDHSLAAALTRLALHVRLEAIPVPEGGWWQDLDTPADLRSARTRLRAGLTKDSDGPVSRSLNRPLSTRVSMALAPLRLSPDLVSVAAFAVAMLGAVLLGLGQGVTAGLMVQAASVIDGVDGELARLLFRARPQGAMLDVVLDRVADAAIMAGLGVWALSVNHNQWAVLCLAVAATAGAMLSMAAKDRVAALGLRRLSERQLGLLMGSRDGRLLLAAAGSILGQPVLALAAVVLTASVTLVLRLLVSRKPSPAGATRLV